MPCLWNLNTEYFYASMNKRKMHAIHVDFASTYDCKDQQVFISFKAH